VVVVVIDTLRADHLPAYGYKVDTAPFLSRLAREGVVFERAYSPASWTAPATASLFTSLYPVQHGVVLGLRVTGRLKAVDERVRLRTLPESLETLPEVMKRSGYATFAVTHNLNISAKMGFAHGFDRFENSTKEDTADRLNARLMAWKKDLIETSPRSFLYLHYLDPHSPYREREPWFDSKSVGHERVISAYDSEIRFVDEQLAQVYDALGWQHETLLVVTADHGEEFWEHGAVGHGRSLFGEVLNVPLIVRFPGGRGGGRRVSTPVSLLDVLPTLRESTGLPREARDEGRSVLPLVLGRQTPPERTLYAHLYRPDPAAKRMWDQRAVLLRGRKIVLGLAEGPQLFDFIADPLDLVNLAEREPRAVDELQRRSADFDATARRYTGDERELVLDPEAVDRLRALGYVQ
jgi:arylsulfatase A-like enzyme